jgi:hypothetical protein
MKSTKRALRRHHRQRMMQHAVRSYALRWEEDAQVQRERVVRWYNNLSKCSCWMCGNPRKYEGKPTRQELRQLLAAQDDAERDRRGR